MDHEGARRLMAEAMEGRLGADDERELALHLVGCQECKTIYDGLQHAHPALTSIQLGEPSTQSVDAAVHRAATVMRGEADPGPMGLSEEPPRLGPEVDINTIRIDSSGAQDEAAAPAATPQMPTGPMQPPAPEAHVRAIEAEPVVAPEPEPEPADTPGPEPEPADTQPPEVPLLEPDLPAAVPPGQPQPSETAPPPPDLLEPPPSEIDRLLDEDRERYETVRAEEELDDRDRMGPGPWLVAIAVTVALAVLAGILISRGEGLFGGGPSLVSADEVRSRVRRALTDMKSLKASFEVTRLNLYNVGREQDSLVYSFSNGRYAGSIDYDRAEGYKENFTLEVREDEIQRAEVTQTSDETRSLLGTGEERRLLISTDPPLGPPDGTLRPTLGLLEQSIGVAARILSEARDLEVVGVTDRNGREMFEVRATMRADELTRGDRIEAALDANNFLPIIVKRSISRENANVLGPDEALTDEALDTAFADNERITTELAELSEVRYDEIVLPGDLALNVPSSVEQQTSDAQFSRVTRAELSSELDFEPLLPRTLPDNYEEQLLAVFRGEPRPWGPNQVYPAPEHVFHTSYFDGKTTIVVTQRHMAERFDLQGSPLQRTGIAISVESVERDEKRFSYGHSPEVPPHVYGFLGNVFVMASGYTTQDELLDVLAELAETPVEVPGPVDASPSPDGSPEATTAP